MHGLEGQCCLQGPHLADAVRLQTCRLEAHRATMSASQTSVTGALGL